MSIEIEIINYPTVIVKLDCSAMFYETIYLDLYLCLLNVLFFNIPNKFELGFPKFFSFEVLEPSVFDSTVNYTKKLVFNILTWLLTPYSLMSRVTLTHQDLLLI